LDRIREATVELSTLDLDALKAAASSASTGLGVEQALTLVRLVNGRPVPAEQDAEFRQGVNAQAQLVTDNADQQLLAVLAGEALINLFGRTNAAIGVAPGLAMRCAAHLGWTPVHPDVATHAENYLCQRSVFIRRRVPPGSRLATANPKGEDGSVQRAEEEHETLRSIVQADRERDWEREQLVWWLLSETRAPTPLGVAHELAHCLVYVPEPVSAAGMIAAKLRRPQRVQRDEAPLSFPEAISDLQGKVPTSPRPDRGARADEDGTPDPEHESTQYEQEEPVVRECLDALLLIRAYNEAKR